MYYTGMDISIHIDIEIDNDTRDSNSFIKNGTTITMLRKYRLRYKHIMIKTGKMRRRQHAIYFIAFFSPEPCTRTKGGCHRASHHQLLGCYSRGFAQPRLI